MEIGFDQPAVVYTGQSQSLTLHLVNKGQADLVPGGYDTWQGVTPTFQLTLVCGDGPGALTTAEDAKDIHMNISNTYGNFWQQASRPPNRAPYWIMQPNPNGGGTVLGTGEHATIEFAVTDIKATLSEGLDHAIAVAYVSWHDIPGYQDGSKALLITKRPGPQVASFTAQPHVAAPGAATVLTWDAVHADGVRFDAPQVPPAQIFWRSGTGPIEGGIHAPPGTTVTLIAYKDISADRVAAHGKTVRSGDDVLTATAQLRITGVSRTDVSAGIGPLGAIVIPARSTRAFLFQKDPGSGGEPQTKTAILDLATHAVTGTLDLNSLIPSKGGTVRIEDAVPSPDGSTIHVLAASFDLQEYYILPLNVSATAYGKPVSLGNLGAWIEPGPRLLATPDGKTVYASRYGGTGSYVYQLDAATYQTKGSWTWRPERLNGFAVAVACNADGSVLLMSGMTGPAVIDVAGGFTEKASRDIPAVREPLVGPGATRAYYLCASQPYPTRGSLVAVDVDLSRGTLRPAHETRLELVPDIAHPFALSPDATTLYLLTGADTVTTFDTATFAATPYPCGLDGDFAPLVMVSGAQPKLLYSTAGGDTVSIITLP